jgi:hypothetical protein
MSDTIKYTSDNGYTGVLYGQSSLSIYNTDGTEIMHTGFRNINTYEELVRAVDEHPKFMEMLRKVAESEDKE